VIARRALGVLEQLWLPVLLVVWWWFASASSTSPFFPPLQEIWGSFVSELDSGNLANNFWSSVRNIGVGLLVAIILGVAIGTLVGRSRAARTILGPYLQFARSIPQVALIPIIIGAFGITPVPKIWAISFACIWPVLLNTIDGIRAIDPAVNDMTRSYQITTRLGLMKVVLPATLPQIMAGIRVSLAIAVIVMVVSEIYGAAEGLGYFINHAKGLFKTEATWMGTLVVGVLGYALSAIFLIIEKRVLHWYHESAK